MYRSVFDKTLQLTGSWGFARALCFSYNVSQVWTSLASVLVYLGHVLVFLPSLVSSLSRYQQLWNIGCCWLGNTGWCWLWSGKSSGTIGAVHLGAPDAVGIMKPCLSFPYFIHMLVFPPSMPLLYTGDSFGAPGAVCLGTPGAVGFWVGNCFGTPGAVCLGTPGAVGFWVGNWVNSCCCFVSLHLCDQCYVIDFNLNLASCFNIKNSHAKLCNYHNAFSKTGVICQFRKAHLDIGL